MRDYEVLMKFDELLMKSFRVYALKLSAVGKGD
jgi:hypothetical protein